MINSKHITKILASAMYFAAIALPLLMVTDVVKGLANEKEVAKEVTNEQSSIIHPPYK